MQTIDVAVVGAGNWGFNHVRTFGQLPGCRLRAVSDLSAKNLDKVRRQFPEVFVSEDYEQVLDLADLQAVVVATTAATHYPIARAALERGRHVLVEKPMTLDMDEAQALIELARSKNRVLMVGHILLFHPVVTALKRAIEAGTLGKIHYIYSQRVNLGQVRTDENSLWSLAPHDISVMLYLLGQYPESVSATGQAFISQAVQDVVFFSLKFPEGQLGHGHASWLDPSKIRQFTIVGSRKMAVFDDMQPVEKLRLYDKGVDIAESYDSWGGALSLRQGDITIPAIQMSEPLRNEALHFLECVREGKPPLTDGINGLEVLSLLQAAQRSLEAGGSAVPTVLPERVRELKLASYHR
ncbi:Gfo/Idh/MocA family protein [Gloeobacter kilaueensis]|uniref:Oxidoreductase n=1 Tax=Gloeobacter kilaueensis (strain ATCC BAA-2537 / CCAP 1431/1 / ULC 316 / JS1) TaxID=1183438 RepID=U5QGD1_GLOK1|nr:Gfo/Idh/MocA family oxidoreductase [Gloeobacter kilaueensis]AGY56725.1 oxidoreductase [Gloeobacter kilaueensis JS1]